ncbi:MAG: hypothetical protein NC400_04875 [Clostridium sp.]|nr:hypothetical protein [Clostridium sp.]
MKSKFLKVLVVLLIIVLLLFSCLGVFSLFPALIAVVTFYYTLKNNNKNQMEALNLQTKLNTENYYLQTSLKVEDNLNRKMEKERSVLENTYNQLENFIFTVSNMLYQNDDFIEMKNDFLRLYGEFVSSINNIKFNSEIFDDRSLCENCEICEIKTYGSLVKAAMDIQREMLSIDEECRWTLDYLVSALNMAAQTKQLLNEKINLQQININDENLIAVRKSQITNSKEALTPQEQAYYNEILSIMENKRLNIQRISEIDILVDNNSKFVGNKIDLAKGKAVQIDKKLKVELYTLIRKYFSIYNFYIKEVVIDVQKNGKKINRGCAKLDFEKNHTARKCE